VLKWLNRSANTLVAIDIFILFGSHDVHRSRDHSTLHIWLAMLGRHFEPTICHTVSEILSLKDFGS